MTAYSAIVAGQVDAESPLDTVVVGSMAYNVIAMFEGDATASGVRLQTNAIAANAVTVAKLADSIKPWIEIESQNLTTESTVDFTGLDSTYDEFMLVLNNVTLSGDGADIHCHVGTGGTPTYSSSGYTAAGQNFVTIASHWAISTGQGNASTESCNAALHFFSLASTSKYKTCRAWSVFQNTSGAILQHDFFGQWASATAVTALRLDISTGTFSGGQVTLFGRRS